MCCIHVCTSVYVHVCGVFVYVYMDVCTDTCVMYLCVHACLYEYRCECVHVCACDIFVMCMCTLEYLDVYTMSYEHMSVYMCGIFVCSHIRVCVCMREHVCSTSVSV